MVKFHGSFEELQVLVSELGYSGEWAESNGKRVYRSTDSALLNWWPSTGTVQFQGPTAARGKIEAAVSAALSNAEPTTQAPAISQPISNNPSPSGSANQSQTSDVDAKRVFVVHGHDESAREQLELILRRLDLQPFVLANTSGNGLTIIEALENEIANQAGGSRFGIVLLTPDDMGYEQGSNPSYAEPRARQNVVLEMGMLIAAFGRQRVAILKKGHVSLPSDASGIIYLEFNNHVKETVSRLCERLRKAGFELTPDQITGASA